MTTQAVERARKAAEYIQGRTGNAITNAVILGSGLSQAVPENDSIAINYSEIPGYPIPTVAGHKGELYVSGKTMYFSGRFHRYEGWDADDVILPVLTAWKIGVKNLLVLNAAGAINRTFVPGELVIIRDHLNFFGFNPLTGPVGDPGLPRFPDMTEAYNHELISLLQSFPDAKLKTGVYAGMLGPTYETPAEIRMLSTLGADLVGMSTVPEVICASACGLKTAAVSAVTNMAAGITGLRLDHKEVLEAGRKIVGLSSSLVRYFVSKTEQ